MYKKYIKPKMIVENMQVDNIITTSGCAGADCDPFEGTPCLPDDSSVVGNN